MVVARGWQRGMGIREFVSLLGTEFQFGLMTKFWRWMLGMAAQMLLDYTPVMAKMVNGKERGGRSHSALLRKSPRAPGQLWDVSEQIRSAIRTGPAVPPAL